MLSVSIATSVPAPSRRQIRQALAKQQRREQALVMLDRTVAAAAEFFAEIDRHPVDGHESARAVLAHLVFWHRRYVTTAQALAGDRPPELGGDAVMALGAATDQACQAEPLPVLARWYVSLQHDLADALRAMPDWGIAFPTEPVECHWSVRDRLPHIESHIRQHMARLRRVYERIPQTAGASRRTPP
jgi:hypothetical protein